MSASASSSLRNLDRDDLVFLHSQKDTLKRMSGRSGGFSGLKPTRLKLWSAAQGVSSSAATAMPILSSIPFNATTFPELTAWMSVYDECRILRAKLHYKFYATTSPSSAPITYDCGIALIFDPSIGAPTSVGAVCEETFTSGPLFTEVGKYASGAGDISATMAMNSAKFASVSATPPKLVPITSSDCPGSSWFVMSGSTAPTAIVLSGYATALGTGGIVTFRAYVELDVEMKLRT
jgi:hypothetical protein